MDSDLQAMIKELIQDYIDNGLIVKVHLSADESVGLGFRMDLIEKAIKEGLTEISDSICSSISDEITIYKGDSE